MSDDDDPTGRPRLHDTNIPALTSAFLSALTTGGTTYAFGLYGNALKKALHLSQSELDTISSATFCAGFVSWIPGLCVDKFGPQCSLSAGGVLGAISLIWYWAVARSVVEVSRSIVVPTLSVLGVMIFVSSSLVTGSVFKIIVGTCGPGTKGSAVGAAKGYVGLGAGAYACLFEALRSGSTSDLDFLPMAAFFAVWAASVPALFLLPEKQKLKELDDTATPTHFRIVYAGLVALASVVLVTSLFELHGAKDADSDSRNYGMVIFVVAVWYGPVLSLLCLPHASHSVLVDQEDDEEEIVALSSPLASPRKGEGDDQLPESSSSIEDEAGLNSSKDGNAELLRESSRSANSGIEMGVPRDIDDDDKKQNGAITVENGDTEEDREHLIAEEIPSPQPPSNVQSPNLNLAEMLRTVTAWLLLWTFTILGGAGTIMTNNMGQMVEALHFPPLVASASLALFSVSQAFARVATGAISEAATDWKIGCIGFHEGVPRPAFLIVASLAGFLSHILLSLATNEIPFIIGVTLSGMAFGMIWPLMVLTVGECFGRDHVGANYMFYDGAASAIGTLLLSKFLAQEVYEDHIHHGVGDAEDDDGLTCFGTGCFRMSHTIVAALSLSCVFSSMGTVYTTRHIYGRD